MRKQVAATLAWLAWVRTACHCSPTLRMIRSWRQVHQVPRRVCRTSLSASASASEFARRVSQVASSMSPTPSPNKSPLSAADSDADPLRPQDPTDAVQQSARRQQLLQCQNAQLQRQVALLQAELAVRSCPLHLSSQYAGTLAQEQNLLSVSRWLQRGCMAKLCGHVRCCCQCTVVKGTHQ